MGIICLFGHKLCIFFLKYKKTLAIFYRMSEVFFIAFAGQLRPILSG